VTGVDITTQEDLLDLLEAEAGRGKTVVATTHDLACAAQRFEDVVAMNQTVIAQGASSLVLDRDVLARTYGGHLLVLGEQAIMLDDAHHHDQVGGTERHYHDDAPGQHR
jgi:ABC-type Mn2+/Zn2+ transport system ATPase subunit